ncbi:MAG: Hpt domain-containing protein [Pseudomonadota bacterium]
MGAAIDLEHLEKYVAGDRALRDEVLGIFEQQAELWTRMLDVNAADEAWRDAAHALKGAARGVGAWEVGELCEKAEALIGDERLVKVRRSVLLDDLKDAVVAAVDAVRRVRA